MISWSMLAWSMSFVGCQASPEPLQCGPVTLQLKIFTKELHACLEDVGNLRQSLKACEERH